jgi:ribonuclease Z
LSEAWILFLGTAAGTPSKKRGLPSILLQYRGKYILLDIGEGSQRSLIKNGIGVNRIDHILISHLHGDHIFGLPGIIQTMSMEGRERKLSIISPEGIEKILNAASQITSYQLEFPIEIIKPEGEISLEQYISVYPFKTCHTNIESFGYIIKAFSTGKEKKERFSLAYTGDTAPCEELIEKIKGADVLIHDSTFDSSMVEKAIAFGHSTSSIAAKVAKMAGVKSLILFHISNRYNDKSEMILDNALKIFKNTFLAEDGMKFYI